MERDERDIWARFLAIGDDPDARRGLTDAGVEIGAEFRQLCLRLEAAEAAEAAMSRLRRHRWLRWVPRPALRPAGVTPVRGKAASA